MKNVTTSFRLDAEKLDRIDRLAESLDRSRSWLINDALERYLAHEEWFRGQVEEGLASAQDGGIPHDEVMREARATIERAAKRRT